MRLFDRHRAFTREFERAVQRLHHARHARGVDHAEILIGDVGIISMFTPSAASTPNTFAATPGCERMPAPMIETLGMFLVRCSSARTPRPSAAPAPRAPCAGPRAAP